MVEQIHKEMLAAGNPEKAVFIQRFFKTGKGEYAESDVFLGLTVPQTRKIALKYKELSLEDITSLLQSIMHEERLLALLILVSQFTKADTTKQKTLAEFYLSQTKYINNWDLVDLSADKIVGEYLLDSRLHGNDKTKILEQLAKSEHIWERRIAMISTAAFIRNGETEMTCKIADILLHDKHDLIQKAVGWMLREVGKRVSKDALVGYLKPRYKTMPRTTLRYAIEHFSPEVRKQYLAGTV